MKEAHQAKVEAQLKEWRAQLEVLQAKAAQAGADARIEIGKHAADLRELDASGRQHLEELKTASAAAWEQVRTGVEDKWNRLSAADALASSGRASCPRTEPAVP